MAYSSSTHSKPSDGTRRTAGHCRVTMQPIRYLVSSPFHDPFSGGNAVYADVSRSAMKTTAPAARSDAAWQRARDKQRRVFHMRRSAIA
jgi:hypothetical protein